VDGEYQEAVQIYGVCADVPLGEIRAGSERGECRRLTRSIQERTKQVPAAELKGAIRDAIASHNMPRKGKMMLSVSGVTQTDINPRLLL